MVPSRLYLNEIESPDYLVIEKIGNQLTPNIDIKSTKVPGRVGEIDQGTELGTRVIKITIGIVGTSKANLDDRERDLTSWLFYDAPKKLQLPNNNKYYMAQVSDVDIENTLIFGRGVITFLCTDPLAYNNDETVVPFAPTDTNPVSIDNNGNKETFPQIELTFNANTTEFSLATEDEYMYFGTPTPIDSTTPAAQRTLVFHDDCSSVSGYSAGISVDGGVIAGTLTSNGSAIRPSDYGSGAQWYGPAGIKTIGSQLQDFTLQAETALKAGFPYQLGRVEIYLLSVSNAVIGKIAIRDSSSSVNSPYMEARVGTQASGKYFVNYTGRVGRWANFGGPIRITRKGQLWEFSASKRDVSGRLFDSFTYRFVDVDNEFQTKLAGIQIHIAKYGTTQPISTIYLEDIQIWNEQTLTASQVPYVFESGDTLLIDSETGIILKNGEPAYYTLGDLDSDFIRLKTGETNLAITPPIVSSGSVTYRERWLR